MGRYYIGVDGGGSATTAFLGNEKGEFLAKRTTASTNYLAVGKEIAFDRLFHLLQALCQNHSISLSEIQCAVFGFSGAGRAEDRLMLSNYLKNILPNAKIHVEHDATLALLSGHNQEYGGLIIAGTGSIAFGIDRSAQTHRVGGNGHLLDDFGSGYDIGRRVLTAVLMDMDGRGEKTLLRELIAPLGYRAASDIVAYVYRSDFSKKEIGDFAKIAFDAAQANDIIANKIIVHGVRSLANLGIALIEKCQDNAFPFLFHGGLFKHQPTYVASVFHSMQRVYPQIKKIEAKHDVGMGALIMAWKMDTIAYEVNK